MHTTTERSSAVDRGGDAVATQIQQVFQKQRAKRWRVAATTAHERIEKLERFRKAILARQAELTKAMYADFRKPPAEVELTEIQPVLSELKHTISHLRKWMKPQRVGTPITLFGTSSRVRLEPKGVVLILSPWNYPFNLLMSPLIAAISAGNCVMLRPSDKVPNTSQAMKKLLEDVFPEDEVAVFTGPSSIANVLLKLPFDHVLFTGSTRIGRQVMAAAAEHLAPVTLELGGQSPVIVDETADVAKAAERIVWGKYLNAGQTCVAPNHVFVHESRAKAFVDEAKKLIESRYGASEEKRRASKDFARIVDSGSHTRLSKMIDDSVAAGAKLEIGGARDASERYVSPTILSGVRPDHAAMSEEIFGPVLPVISYRSLDEVVSDVRSRGKPLAMYIFTESRENKEKLLRETTAGGTVINNVILHLANPDLPFGGVGESGMGNYHGFYGFKTFSHERAVLTQGFFSAVAFFYPPYTEKVQRMITWVTKFFS
jgi:aldehyde dehydrogenase (NAD+)